MAKTPASLALFTKPNITIIEQIDKRLNIKINKFGCRFMSLLAIPQIINNKSLTPEGILYIYHEAVNMGPDVMNENCTCGENEHKIMSLAFDMLDDKDRFCRQIFISDGAGKFRNENMLPTSTNILFFIVDFNTSSSKEYGGHHFMLYNGIGNLIYDPGGGSVDKSMIDMNRWLCYKVYSRSYQQSLEKDTKSNPDRKTLLEKAKELRNKI
jgi:hypothetical protein